MNDDAAFPIDTLLRERAWVRALARSLVRTEHDADDLEQDAWADALASPPPQMNSPRGWLATVLHRRAGRARRTAARVHRRELAAARPEGMPAAADLVAVAEQHRRLMGFVLELAEPVRSAVLARFVEGRPPREIAARSGEPVKTVQSRIARGLDQLRRRLDADSGGERRKWLAAFAPIVDARDWPSDAGTATRAIPGSATATAASIAGGGLLMATKAKAVLASAAALLVGGAIWWAVRPNATDAPPVGRSGPESAKQAGDSSLAARPGPLAAPGASVASKPDAEIAAGNASATVLVRVVERVDAVEMPVPGATVWVRMASGTFERLARATTGPSGEAQGLPVVPDAAAVVWAWADGFALSRVDLPAGVGSRLDVVLGRGKPVTVAFTSATDPTRELSADEVRARFGDARSTAATLVPALESGKFGPQDMLRRMVTDPLTWSIAGEIPLGGDSPRLFAGAEGPQGLVLVSRPGDEPYLAWVEQTESGALRVRVPLGEVVPRAHVRIEEAESGVAIPGAALTPYAEAGDDALFVPGPALRADSRGELDVPLAREPARATRSATWWVTAPGRAGVIDRFALARAGGGELTVRLPLTATARGRAWLGSGAPAAGATVLSGWKGRYVTTRVAPDGAFELAGIPVGDPGVAGEGNAMLFLIEPGPSAAGSRAAIQARPGETVEVNMGKPSTGEGAVVHGRVTSGGRPLGGLQLGLDPSSAAGARMVMTDADGRFRIEGVSAGAHDFLLLLGPPGLVDDVRISSSKPLVLAAGDDRELTFDLPPGRLRVRLVDDRTGAALVGAIAFVVPKDPKSERARYPGFEFFPGWVATTDAEGRAVLLGLPIGVPHVVEASTIDRRLKGGVADAFPVADPSATELVIRLK